MITTPKRYQDDWSKTFGSGEYTEFFAEQKDMDSGGEWIPVTTSKLHFEELQPMDAYTKVGDPTNITPLEALLDTANSFGLTVEIDGVMRCVRNCTMPSLLSTIRAKGIGFFDLDANGKAGVFNYFMSVCRNSSRMLMREGKVCAIVSQKYAEMPISDLLIATENLEQYLDQAEFMGGFISHDLTTAKWRYPKSVGSITAAYRNALATGGRTMNPNTEIIPVVEFRSSDTTGQAANLLTYLQIRPGHLMPIGGGLRVNHVTSTERDSIGNRKTPLQVFEEGVMTLYSKLEFSINEIIPAMLKTPIEYPANTFIGLCQKAQIPQKWGGVVEEELRKDWPDHSGCTFLDIYEYITSITAIAVRDHAPNSERILDLEEGIARIARSQSLWQRYDRPGTVAWVQSNNQ